MYSKKRIDKFYLYGIVLLLVMFVIAYANIGTLLTINGVTNIRQNTWNVKFTDIDYPETSPNDNLAGSSNIDVSDNKIDFKVDLDKPGDIFRFDINVFNNSSMDAMLDGFTMTPTTLPNGIRYSVFWDNGHIPTDYDLIPEGQKFPLHVIVEYRTDIDSGQLLPTDKNLKMEIEMNFVQATKKAEALKTNNFATDDWNTIRNVLVLNPSTYAVGAEKEVDLGNAYGKHTVRVANNTTPDECDGKGFSQTACGFVVEFKDVITTHNMNPSGEYKGVNYPNGWNKDGWPKTSMRTFLNTSIFNALPEDLRNVIGETYVVSSHGNKDANNFTSTDRLYLLSTHEIYEDDASNTVSDYDTSYNNTRQLDYYEGVTEDDEDTLEKVIKLYNDPDLEEEPYETNWWLRSAISDNGDDFFYVVSDGDWLDDIATYENGVSPAFRIV